MSDYWRWQLDRLEHQMRLLAGELSRLRVAPFSSSPAWIPALNIYRCADRYLICVDLAGVSREALSVRLEARRLRISGERPPPQPQGGLSQPVRVLALEIDHGRFERELVLPEDVDPERVTATQRDGWLWIELPVKST